MAGRGVDALCGLAGRGRVVRAARFLLHRSRRDLPNNPRTNGEYALQRWVLAAVPRARPLVALDVGANLGRWSQQLLWAAEATGHRVDLHAFEPAGATYQLLAAKLPATVRLHQLALSDEPGERTLHVIRPGAGRNSLYPFETATTTTESVTATTVDAYVAEQGIGHVDLLKIDAEGHDFRVLKGGERCFRDRRVLVAQFEYGHRWVNSRQFLKDVFALAADSGYQVGKLTPAGVEFYARWDPDLETFVEGNYLACTGEMAQRLPRTTWWK